MEADTSTTNAQDTEIDAALCRATLYSALALGFRSPMEETKARLSSEEAAQALGEAASLLNAGLASAVKPLAIANYSLETLVASHRRLFGHTARSGVPPYETEYGAEALFQQPQELGDLHGFYNAFGLALNRAEHERADHVSCECEFLAFLALKEAYALKHGDASMLEETRKAERLFLRDHLGRFFPAFANKLVRATNPHPIPLPRGEDESEGDFHGFYRALAELGLRFIASECARWNVPLGPRSLSLRPATDDRVPMACGSDSCPAMPGAAEPHEMD